MSGGDFDDDWEPVSAAEMKVIQAKQERSNKISKIMGDYLLKGYKMLASSCEDCGCILLQDKQSRLYCVACNECDVEGSKDDPALSQIAADSKIREGASPGTISGAGGADSGIADSPLSHGVAAAAATGIPSLMNAAPAVNGNGVGSAYPNSVHESSSSGGGGSGVTQPKGKIPSLRVGNRASTVGVRSLMSDVGRNAYEAFAAYQDDSAASAASAASATPSTLPPHGPAVSRELSPPLPAHPVNGGTSLPASLPTSHSLRVATAATAATTDGKLALSEYDFLSGTLKRKLVSAGQRLENSNSNEEDSCLCALIRNYADALEAVNKLQNN